MLNWDGEITPITDAEARMLRVSLDRVQSIVDELEVQQVLQNPFVSGKELRDRLVPVYEALIVRNESLASFSYRCMLEKQMLAAILRRWTGERRIRSFNDGLVGGLPSLIRHATRSAAANMWLVAPIGAPPRLA